MNPGKNVQFHKYLKGFVRSEPQIRMAIVFEREGKGRSARRSPNSLPFEHLPAKQASMVASQAHVRRG